MTLIKPRFLGTALAALAAVVLNACSANGSGSGVGLNNGATASSHIKAAPLVNLALSPSHIDAGGSITLTWSSTNATSCIGTGGLAGVTINTDQTTGLTFTPSKVGTWSYGLTCKGPGGTASDSDVVTVGPVPPPTLVYDINPAVIKPGDSTTIMWTTDNADSCTGAGGTGSDGWVGTQPADNLAGFVPPPFNTLGSYEYMISCSGPGGTTQATHIVIVSPSAATPAPTMTLAATPNQLDPGDTTSLSWSSLNATSCAASGGSGADGWSGAKPTASTGTAVGPILATGSYTYTLTCIGPGGSASRTITVLVSPPNITLQALVAVDVAPANIVAGASANLTWSTANADSCVATGNWAGGQPLLGVAVSTGALALPGYYTYTLTCTGPSGSASASASLTVTPGVGIINTFAANPTTVSTGGDTTLSWSSSEANSCVANGGTGSDGWSGTEPTASAGVSVGPLTVSGTYTYTLTCIGSGGPSAPQSVNVTVSSANPSTPTVTAFTAAPSTIVVGQAATLTWSSSGATSCAGTGGTGTDGWTGSVGTSSTGTSTGPIAVPGSYTYTLTCTGPGGVSTPASAVVNVNAAPALPAAVSVFTATPSNIQVTQSSTLSWASIGASGCVASGGTGSDNWSGNVPAASTGVSTGAINTAGSYTYTLLCSGSGGTGTPASVTVNVSNAPGSAAAINTFTALPSTVVAGGTTSLAWTTTNASTCTASGGTGSDGWSGGVGPTSVNTPIGPLGTAGTYTYTLTCNGAGGQSAPSSVTVNVVNAIPLPTVSAFTATPGTIQTGQSTSLTWASAGATSCTASGGTGSDGWTGSEPAAGTVSVGPLSVAGSYTYILTCSGPGGTGTPSSTVVNVNAVTPPAGSVTAFLATPSTLLTGQSSVLTWASNSATSCTATGGTGTDGWHGSVGTSSLATTVGPFSMAGTYTYTLTCTGAGGTGAPTSVTINVTAAPAPPVVAAFTVLPTNVTTGTPVSITWETLGATSCTASGGTGSDNWGGAVATSNVGYTTQPLTPAGSYTYTLTCSGAGGSSSPSSVSVTVTDAPTPPAIQAFLATPAAVQTGGSTLFTWTALGATSCTASGGTGTDGWGGAVSTTSLGTASGAITPAGTYTYTLSCTGAGGTTTSTQTVVATNAIPPASIVTFTATPATISTGQSVLLTWVSAGATACTASGGTGSDGWHGSKPTSAAATTVGPLNTTGVYAYTLNCTGPGGASAPASVSVAVNPVTPAASVTAITAAPSTVQVGQYSSLAWTTANATSCTASGGTGSDGWSGTVGATVVSKTVGPFTTTGTVTYTLTCTGPGGTGSPSSTNVTVNAASAVQPTVSLLVNGNNPATVQPGTAPTLSWTSSNATVCTASGGTGTDGWAGVKATSTTGVTISALNTPGNYSYVLTCTGTGGSGTSTAQVMVIASSTSNCGLPSLPTSALLATAASDSDTINGVLCLGCMVSGLGNEITPASSSPATLNVVAGLLNGSVVLHVKDNSTTYPAGRQAGFTVSEGNQVLSLSLVANLQVSTYLNGALQETASTNNHLLGLQALGLLSVSPNAGFAGFTTTKPFNEVSIQVDSVANVLSSVNVYRACVSLN